MRTKQFLLGLLFLLLLLTLLINPAPLFACSCAPPPPPAAALAEATAVFAGTVINIEVEDGEIFSSADPVAVTFEVATVWKGPVQQTLLVTTARDSASCGYSFEVGQSYLVYAYDAEDALQTGLCSRTTDLSSASDDLAVLGEGAIPAAAPVTTAPGPALSSALLLGLAVALVLVVVGLSLWYWRRPV
jgi:hypothetical protein